MTYSLRIFEFLSSSFVHEYIGWEYSHAKKKKGKMQLFQLIGYSQISTSVTFAKVRSLFFGTHHIAYRYIHIQLHHIKSLHCTSNLNIHIIYKQHHVSCHFNHSMSVGKGFLFLHKLHAVLFDSLHPVCSLFDFMLYIDIQYWFTLGKNTFKAHWTCIHLFKSIANISFIISSRRMFPNIIYVNVIVYITL